MPKFRQYRRARTDHGTRQAPGALVVCSEMALGAAVEKRIEKGFYISDLWQILMKIYSHAKYDQAPM
jgi:hypothetical protein